MRDFLYNILVGRSYFELHVCIKICSLKTALLPLYEVSIIGIFKRLYVVIFKSAAELLPTRGLLTTNESFHMSYHMSFSFEGH